MNIGSDSPLFISLADEGIAHVPLYSIPFDLVAMMLILPAKLLARSPSLMWVNNSSLRSALMFPIIFLSFSLFLSLSWKSKLSDTESGLADLPRVISFHQLFH